MKTQAELIREHRGQLDQKFLAKYPNGRFCLQNFHGFGLHWCPRRHTGARRPVGISTLNAKTAPAHAPIGHIKQERFQNSSFGKCYNYDSLDKLLRACKRHDVPVELVTAFKERYNKRFEEGFTK